MTNKKILILIFVVAFLTLLIGCLPGLTPPTPKGVISGRIMVPSSETTKDITGWIPVANATVTLTDSSGITHTVTTDEDGYYTFTNIAVNANTIITATAAIDGNTVIVKDVIPQAVAADEDYNAKTADAESTALALIVEELLEQGLDPEYINLEEIQDSDNFTEVVGQVTSVLEENGNVTTDSDVTNIVDYVAGDIINPPAYTPPEELPEPEPEPEPGPETVILTYIVVLPVEMTLFVGESGTITSVTAHYSDGSTTGIALGNCTYSSSAPGVAKVIASEGYGVNAISEGTATITVSYGGKIDTIVVTVSEPSITPETYTITATADTGGSIIPSGDVTVNEGSDIVFAITPDYFHSINDIWVDESPVATVSPYTYTFFDVTEDHTIEATFELLGAVYNQTKETHHATIKDAITGAGPDNTILVAAGNYSEYFDISIPLSIIGVSRDSVTIDTSATSSYGIHVTADNVTLKNFTLKGPSPSASAYGIKTSGCNNVTFENLLVEDSGRSGVDFNGCSNITINNIEAKNNGGVGIAITDSSNVTVSNITTSGNKWVDPPCPWTTGMAIFASGVGCNNITLTGINSFGEVVPFYTEIEAGTSGLITYLSVENDFEYILRHLLDPLDGIAFFYTLEDALAFGESLVTFYFVVADEIEVNGVIGVITEIPLGDYGTNYFKY